MAVNLNGSQNAAPSYDPAFRARCDEIMAAWRSGDLPYTAAADRLNALKQEAADSNHVMHQALVENILGIMLGYRSSYGAATRHFELARDLFRRAGAGRHVASTTLNLGETYRLRGNFTRARKLFHEAYEAARLHDNRGVQAVALTNEGQIWLSLRSLDRAQTALLQALDLTRKPWYDEETDKQTADRYDNLCEVHYALASVYLSAGELDQAWAHARESYTIATQINHKLRLGLANRALGNVITALPEIPDPDFDDDPNRYYRQAMTYFREVKAEGEIGKTLFAQAESMARRGRRNSAAKLYHQAMVIFTNLDMIEDAARAADAQLNVT